MEQYIAIDNAGLWPNLTRLSDQTLGALVFNQPCHGKWSGEVEAWVSNDGGRFWQKRGVPVPHGEGEIRMNLSAGLGTSGEWISVVSGYSPKDPSVRGGRAKLPALVSRSQDLGRSWEIIGQLPEIDGRTPLIPYGDIVIADDGSLRTFAYCVPLVSDSPAFESLSFFLKSSDGGATWRVQGTIPAQGANETAVIDLGEGRWLAAVREIDRIEHAGHHLTSFQSNDDGCTWFEGEVLGTQGHFPAAFLKWNERLLLFYGNRCFNNMGIDARRYDPVRKAWSTPQRIVSLPGAGDVGYPSALVNSSNEVVLAYYSNYLPCHQRYHMGVVILGEDELLLG